MQEPNSHGEKILFVNSNIYLLFVYLDTLLTSLFLLSHGRERTLPLELTLPYLPAALGSSQQFEVEMYEKKGI